MHLQSAHWWKFSLLDPLRISKVWRIQFLLRKGLPRILPQMRHHCAEWVLHKASQSAPPPKVMWMDHRKHDETHIDNHLPSSQTSAKMHHAGSISIWTLAHRSLHPHLEVWYLEIELKIPISLGKSLPRMNGNPLYLICFEFSKCSGCHGT